MCAPPLLVTEVWLFNSYVAMAFLFVMEWHGGKLEDNTMGGTRDAVG